MKIVTVQFDNTYKNFYDVFRRSCAKNIPSAELVNIKIPVPANTSGRPNFCHHNASKLMVWVEYASKCNDNMILADCDMVALRDPVEIWDMDFDICYTRCTVRDERGTPINGGIVFVKPTERAREFLKLWESVDQEMYFDEKFHKAYMHRYAGMNQASFGYLLEHPERYGAKLACVTTREYNAVSCDWQYIDNRTAFLHIKGQLRRMITSGLAPQGLFKAAMIKWEEYCKS